MQKFDTKVQEIKYKVLKKVAEYAWQGTLLENITEIPEKIMPGKIPTMRCCVYKERAIVNERVKLAVGGNRFNKKVIQVIDIACNDCPAGGYEVTSACRGCLAHRCAEACKRGAITFGTDQKAHIDKDKCVECGMCSRACPYNSIVNYKRPCENSCKVGAISMGEEKEAKIDYEKCVSCGACVYMCPFGAITDRSYILDVIDFILNKEQGYKVHALVAPSISSQFGYAKLGQIMTAIKILGFDDIVEVALGADMVADKESAELEEKGFLTSSCCPAFVSYVEKNFPLLKDNISHNLSPAGTIAKYIKERDKECKNVFIGPCTAKKSEFQRKEYAGLIDSVITFEELQALIDSKNIDVTSLEETEVNEASYFGRIFARSGGVSEAVGQALKEQGSGFEAKPLACSGLNECKKALLLAQKGMLPNNFIEGLACEGGCINGAGCLTHGEKNKAVTDNYGKAATNKTISAALETKGQ
ncbi:MAG: 4Fe-4S dicluster domain-containing protein [Clostridia bacterium]|nr:4Fe-4S dicluster domain-containing protein [Clostridia bacterium]